MLDATARSNFRFKETSRVFLQVGTGDEFHGSGCDLIELHIRSPLLVVREGGALKYMESMASLVEECADVGFFTDSIHENERNFLGCIRCAECPWSLSTAVFQVEQIFLPHDIEEFSDLWMHTVKDLTSSGFECLNIFINGQGGETEGAGVIKYVPGTHMIEPLPLGVFVV